MNNKYVYYNILIQLNVNILGALNIGVHTGIPVPWGYRYPARKYQW